MRPRFAAVNCVIGAIVLASGCDSGKEPNDEANPGPIADSTKPIPITAAATCRDCLTVSRLAVFGADTTGPARRRVSKAWVVQDKIGRFWIGENEQLKVHDADGEFLARIGRQGSGPGEFQRPMPIFVDSSGVVHVLDHHLARETHVDSALTITMEQPSIGVNMDQVAPLSQGRYVTNAWLRSEEGIGHPLHIFRGTEVLRSFGASEHTPETASTSQRIIASDAKGRIFSAKRFVYEIDIWTDSGRHLALLVGPTINRTLVNSDIPFNFSDNPPPNVIEGLHAYEDRVWVLIRMMTTNWRDYYSLTRSATGTEALMQKPHARVADIYRTRVDVIDLRTRQVIAQHLLPGWFHTFAGPGLILESVLTDEHELLTAVWSAKLRTR